MQSPDQGEQQGWATPWRLRTVPSELEQRWLGEGFWNADSLGQLLDRELRAAPDTGMWVHSVERPWHGTFEDMRQWSLRLASGLRRRGIGVGDVVAFQLPNSIEAAVAFYAASFLGAVVVPIVHFYGPKEVGYILHETRAKAFITITQFGSSNYLKALPRLHEDLGTIEVLGMVGLDEPLGELIPFADLLAARPLAGPVDVDPAAPALVAFTSGTTADPKGVIHSHQTVGAEVRQLAALQPPGGRPLLVGAPVGHAIGMLSALLLPVMQHRAIHLTDVWDPARVLELMLEFDLASGSGATFFLTSLLDHPSLTDEHLALMAHIGLGGAAVPTAVADRATAAGISIVRMYGSTEHPSITGASHDQPLHQRTHTDGRALAGVEIRLVDRTGAEVPVGEPGQILSRGPDCCMGYTDPDLTAAAFDHDGWFRTGDIGVLDDDGCLRITDRISDIIIRGGENISAVEVEELLSQLPGLLEVAVVAAPDQRLGEHACAFVRIARAAPIPDLDWVRSVLSDAGLARQKWPEELRVINQFPRTASGKIQKSVLREMLRAEAEASG